MIKEKTNENFQPRPPVVVILGHVDHGKTTLLDTIRKTNVVEQAAGGEPRSIVERESGGITQHIGAYQVNFNNKIITFIDTPGHEAFSQMRSRGAKVADIAVLVIAAEEGVRPQTKEVISYIKKQEIPVIIALNKMDKPQTNPGKVIGELEKEGLLVEERGGKAPVVKISAKEGTGINELLEMIILVAEMEELPTLPAGRKAETQKPASGVVIESCLDSRRGVSATLLVLEGILKIGQWIACGKTYGKTKILENFQGKKIEQAGPSTPVVVIGLNEAPVVGEKFKKVESEKEAKENLVRKPELTEIISDKDKSLNLILKADVQGSLEAILETLKKTDLEEIGLNILKSGVGNISEADVKLAYPAKAIIIGFRVKTSNNASNLAKRSGVKIRTYDVIYELFEGVKKAAEKLLEPEKIREDLGKLKVLAIFRKEKSRMIIGGKVIEGRAINKVSVDVVREGDSPAGQKIASGKIIQLQHNKKDVVEVEKGREAGILYEGEPVIEEGDILEIYRKETKKREL